MPFMREPGHSSQEFSARDNVAETGATMSDTIRSRDNDVGLGSSYLNTVYDLSFATPSGASAGRPTVDEAGFVLHDIYHPGRGPLTAYFDGSLKHSTATNTSNVDPRASLVYSASNHDVARFSLGRDHHPAVRRRTRQRFVPSPTGGAGINCVSNSIGSAPSSVLKPERGVDTELVTVIASATIRKCNLRSTTSTSTTSSSRRRSR
jgi:hypothetical protein